MVVSWQTSICAAGESAAYQGVLASETTLLSSRKNSVFYISIDSISIAGIYSSWRCLCLSCFVSVKAGSFSFIIYLK